MIGLGTLEIPVHTDLTRRTLKMPTLSTPRGESRSSPIIDTRRHVDDIFPWHSGPTSTGVFVVIDISTWNTVLIVSVWKEEQFGYA